MPVDIISWKTSVCVRQDISVIPGTLSIVPNRHIFTDLFRHQWGFSGVGLLYCFNDLRFVSFLENKERTKVMFTLFIP